MNCLGAIGRRHRYVGRPNCFRCGRVNPRWDKDRCALRANDLNSKDVYRFEPCGAKRADHPEVRSRHGFFPHEFVEVKEVRRG